MAVGAALGPVMPGQPVLAQHGSRRVRQQFAQLLLPMRMEDAAARIASTTHCLNYSGANDCRIANEIRIE